MNQMNKMNYFSCVMVIVIILSALTQAHEDEPQEDYYNGVLEPQLLHQLMQQQQQQYLSTDKRSCVRRGGPCDHNTKCCNALCKCNLWGTNCRCQRQGLFQKWGR